MNSKQMIIIVLLIILLVLSAVLVAMRSAVFAAMRSNIFDNKIYIKKGGMISQNVINNFLNESVTNELSTDEKNSLYAFLSSYYYNDTEFINTPIDVKFELYRIWKKEYKKQKQKEQKEEKESDLAKELEGIKLDEKIAHDLHNQEITDSVIAHSIDLHNQEIDDSIIAHSIDPYNQEINDSILAHSMDSYNQEIHDSNMAHSTMDPFYKDQALLRVKKMQQEQQEQIKSDEAFARSISERSYRNDSAQEKTPILRYATSDNNFVNKWNSRILSLSDPKKHDDHLSSDYEMMPSLSSDYKKRMSSSPDYGMRPSSSSGQGHTLGKKSKEETYTERDNIIKQIKNIETQLKGLQYNKQSDRFLRLSRELNILKARLESIYKHN